MGLTWEQIRDKQLVYFNSDIAAKPAFLRIHEYFDEDEGEWFGGEDKCVYRDSDGHKCAVGVLIPKKLYEVIFDEGDGLGVNGLPENVIRYLGVDNVELLQKMQECHDELAREFYDLYPTEHFGKLYLEKAKEKFPAVFA